MLHTTYVWFSEGVEWSEAVEGICEGAVHTGTEVGALCSTLTLVALDLVGVGREGRGGVGGILRFAYEQRP